MHRDAVYGNIEPTRAREYVRLPSVHIIHEGWGSHYRNMVPVVNDTILKQSVSGSLAYNHCVSKVIIATPELNPEYLACAKCEVIVCPNKLSSSAWEKVEMD